MMVVEWYRCNKSNNKTVYIPDIATEVFIQHQVE